jgi:hypothetical protein
VQKPFELAESAQFIWMSESIFSDKMPGHHITVYHCMLVPATLASLESHQSSVEWGFGRKLTILWIERFRWNWAWVALKLQRTIQKIMNVSKSNLRKFWNTWSHVTSFFLMDSEGLCIIKRRAVLSKFTAAEDARLRSLVHDWGTANWRQIADKMGGGRTTRQCRERWQNYLRRDIVNGPWTAEEERLLVEKYAEYGPIWRTIQSFFPCRTDIDIKNCWLRRQRKLRREISKTESCSTPAQQSLMIPFQADADEVVWEWDMEFWEWVNLRDMIRDAPQPSDRDSYVEPESIA